MQTTDVLILAVARRSDGLSIAGMTTERDATTGLRWVRPVPEEGRWSLDDLRYADGTLVRPGDVVRLDLAPAGQTVPFIENTIVDLSGSPLELVRRLSGERRQTFFASHLDQSPGEVLKKDPQRSICLVRPDYLTGSVSQDPEMGGLEVDFALGIGNLHSKRDMAVHDIYWRALMKTWLGDDEFFEIEDARLRATFSEIYVVLGYEPKGILGIHTVPEYDVVLDEDAL